MRLLTYVMLFLCAEGGLAFPTQNDFTPGAQSLTFSRASDFWMRFDLGLVDAKVTTSPPDAVRFDRRVEELLIIGGHKAFGKQVAIRTNVAVEAMQRRQAEAKEPIIYVDEQRTTIRPSLDVIFITATGLELFGGAEVTAMPAYTQKSTSDVISGEKKFGAINIVAPRGGIVRRGANWSGGAYYVMGSEEKQTFSNIALGQTTSSGSDYVQEPSAVAVFGQFSAGSIGFRMEAAAVQAGEGGPRTETGGKIQEDYLRANLGVLWNYTPALGFRFGFAHQTLSYADGAYMSLETMPLTSYRAAAVFGDAKRYGYLGLIYGRSSDGQSIPEFNARYDWHAYALSSGLFLSF